MSTPVVDESALTATNRSVQVDGATLVYRRFGNLDGGGLPLLLLQHFRGNLDTWDPVRADGLVRACEVVLLDNHGVGASTGVVPDNAEDMARDALATRIHSTRTASFDCSPLPPEEGRARGMEFLPRISARTADTDESADLAARDAQLAAITRWGIPETSKLARLGGITQPTLVANGEDDPMMITENSHLLPHPLPQRTTADLP
jgi:pimeloyl-ACP methyl ester carboxylesterase